MDMFHAILPSEIKLHDSRTNCEEQNDHYLNYLKE
jgi:hypothetical protein